MESQIGSAPSRNWADLQNDLLYCVLGKLTLLSDYIRFGAVCKSWFFATLEQKQERKKSIQKEPPLLLIPVADNPEERALYSICEGKVYDYRFSIPYRKRCCGSSHGWWAIAEKDSAQKELAITLFNPFLGSTIHLPSIIKDLERYKVVDPNYKVEPEFLVEKVILSCDPSSYPDDYVVAAIYDHDYRLALLRSGEKSWKFGSKLYLPVNDILFHKGLLYAVSGLNRRSYLAAADYVNHEHGEEGEEIPHPENKSGDGPPIWLVASDRYSTFSYRSYLVESSNGNLLLIRRIFFWDGVSKFDPKDTIDFKVYKLELDEMYPDNGEGKWVEVQGLENDDALFLGPNHSICIPVSHFPNCTSNSIYYTDDYPDFCQSSPPHEAKDLGVFHLENRSRRNHFILDPSLSYMAPAAWISPAFR